MLFRSAEVLLVSLFSFAGFGLLLASRAEAATYARNGTSVLSGYVELGGTLRRNTSIMQGNNYKLGIGTRTPQNMLHLNSGTCNVAMRIQSTDPFALIAFQDNLVSDTSLLPYMGGWGDALAFGLGTTNMAIMAPAGSLGPRGMSKTISTARKLRAQPESAFEGELVLDTLDAYDVVADYLDSDRGLWIYGEANYGTIVLDPNSLQDTYVYNDLDTTAGAPPANGCNVVSPTDTGHMIYDTTNHYLWVCEAGTWKHLAPVAP